MTACPDKADTLDTSLDRRNRPFIHAANYGTLWAVCSLSAYGAAGQES